MARNWNTHYADPANAERPPDALLVNLAGILKPGCALDLACGAGRHAIHLARLGWQVTAVDAAPAAVERLRRAAPEVDARVADLARGEFVIEPDHYDLICDFLYLQRDLFPAIRAGIRSGGVFLGAIRLTGSFTMASGELRAEFNGWKIQHYSEAGGSARIVAIR